MTLSTSARRRSRAKIDAAADLRQQADKVLEEYRERLKEARAQSEEIVQRARQTAESHEHEGRERGKEILEEAAKRAERDIEAASKRALDDIRREVADLTVMATEKVTRKTLDDADQRRLVEEALNELDFSSISSGARATEMEELAQVYARALFEVALEQGKLDELREQLAQFADALDQNRELAVFFFSPYFSTTEKIEALGGLLDGADEALLNFLGLLIENHRMPVIFRARHEYERLWDGESKRFCRSRSPARLSSINRPPRVSARRSASALDARSRSRRAWIQTFSAASSSGSATRSSMPLFAIDWSGCACRWGEG